MRVFNKTKALLILNFIIAFDTLSGQSLKETEASVKDSLQSFERRGTVKESSLGVELAASLLPKANINTIQGNYHLKSALHSSFSMGINYQVNLNILWGISSGLKLNLTKRNLFLHIPDGDLPGYLSTEGAPQIEDKNIYFRLALPIKIVRKFNFNDNGFWDLSAGINLNYSGFSNDEITTTRIADSNFQLKQIFYGNLKSNNNKKPWFTFNLGSAKNLILKNNNLLAIGLFFELSFTDFIRGEYEITIPDKPVTKGTYSITGSCVGLALQYTFTGTNKRLIRGYQKEKSL